MPKIRSSLARRRYEAKRDQRNKRKQKNRYYWLYDKAAKRIKPQAKFKPWQPYRYRAQILKAMGFASYQQYLKSPLWEYIRAKVFKKQRTCQVCHSVPATQIHHGLYTLRNMAGESTNQLWAICKECHEKIEFNESGNKVSNAEAEIRRQWFASRPKKKWKCGVVGQSLRKVKHHPPITIPPTAWKKQTKQNNAKKPLTVPATKHAAT